METVLLVTFALSFRFAVVCLGFAFWECWLLHLEINKRFARNKESES